MSLELDNNPTPAKKRTRRKKTDTPNDSLSTASSTVCSGDIMTASPVVSQNNIQMIIEETPFVPAASSVKSLPVPLPVPLLTPIITTEKTVVSKSCPNLPKPVINNNDTDNDLSIDFKKRGRKPKGGKLISKNGDEPLKPPPIPNVILHLKCSVKDLNDYNSQRNKLMSDPLNYNSEAPPDIMTYNVVDQKTTFSLYGNNSTETTSTAATMMGTDYAYNNTAGNNLSKNARIQSLTSVSGSIAQPQNDEALCAACNAKMGADDNEPAYDDSADVNIKDVNQKLKKLKINLYKNSMPDKKSACFWCTYEFDNQACYIPKYEMDGAICGYGSFCRPECGVAFLMKENIDDSTKFERYHLLNQIYSKVYNFKNNIKPAPNPYYLLDKFYGNLSIQEYRKLLNTEHMLLVIDKPLTRILPELHEDTDDFIMGIYGGNKGGATQAGGVYKVKRQSEKQQGPSKSSIMRGKFNLA